ncbi:dihydroorotase [Wenxinia saemankumensis]|uniref:Dihydropyrimidinase/dihydroorotase/allantoinase n=1 Tax=Wenxinia saemankumensis TaxID=1447782 RepID=A0A1M6CYV6_9RHOB|nr:dihydroorotase family protein [Wenxinia saemankumensis]SHI66176.1 dihydropyrimidinase/dihydroorotase/allantoinase [Wenxinia saemankumensis]
MTDLVVTGGEVLLPDGPAWVDVSVAGGRVQGLHAPGTAPPAPETVNATGLTVLPGIVDIHFHVRAPAYPERGTVLSETRAAAAGGVTTLFEMPISKPCCATPGIFEDRRAHFAEHAVVDFGLYAAPGDMTEATRDRFLDLGAIAFKIFTTPAPPGRGDEFDGLAFPGEADQLRALELLAGTGRPVVVHAESASLLAHFEAAARATRDPASGYTHNAARPAVCESVAVAKLLAMNIRAGAKLHIAHVTSAETVAVLRAFAGTSDFTAETCPQYLFATEDDVDRAGVFAKVNPPIRTRTDQDALWQAIADGIITHVTTDHAPFAFDEKNAAAGDFFAAPPGSPGIETLLPAMLDAVAAARLTLKQAHDLCCANGARLYGLAPRKGTLLPGADADMALVDLAGETQVRRGGLVSHARDVAHLWDGRVFRGRVARTLLAGRTVWDGAEVTGAEGAGRFVRP